MTFWSKIALCIPLGRTSNVLSSGEGFIRLSPPNKLKLAVPFLFYLRKDSFLQYHSVLSEFYPMANNDYVT